MLQGLADSQADAAAGQALRRLDLLSSLHTAVAQHQDANRRQAAAHQAIVDHQVIITSSKLHVLSLVDASLVCMSRIATA